MTESEIVAAVHQALASYRCPHCGAEPPTTRDQVVAPDVPRAPSGLPFTGNELVDNWAPQHRVAGAPAEDLTCRTGEIARRLGVAAYRVRAMARAGELLTIDTGDNVVVCPRWFIEWMLAPDEIDLDAIQRAALDRWRRADTLTRADRPLG